MAITFTDRGTNKFNASSGSVTPTGTPSHPLLLMIAAKTGLDPLSVEGGGASSWIRRTNAEPGSNSIIVYEASGGTLDTSAVTVTWSGTVVTHLHLVECGGARTSASCIAGSKESERVISGTNGTSVDAMMPNLAHANNAWLGFIMVGGETTGITTDASLTNLSELITAGQLSSQADYVIGNNISDRLINWTWNASLSQSFVVFEIVEATANTPGSEIRREQRRGNVDNSGNYGSGTNVVLDGSSVVLVAIMMEDATLEDPTSVNDGTNEYTKVGPSINFDATHRLTVWAHRQVGPATVPISGIFADAPTGSLGWIIELFNVKGNTDTDWFGDSDSAIGTGVTTIASPALTLASTSAVIAFIAKDTNASDISPDTGWAPASQQGAINVLGPRLGVNAAVPLGTLSAIWRSNSGDTTPSASFAISDAGIIAFEVLQPVQGAGAAGASGSAVYMTRVRPRHRRRMIEVR